MNIHRNFMKAVYNSAYLLWVLREYSITSFEQLHNHFDKHPGIGYLREGLRQLRDAGLITLQDKYVDGVDHIEINASVAEILATLGASLTDLANRTHDTISVQPLFPRLHSSQGGADVFVLMPFKPELKPVYEDHLTKVCEGCGLSVARADDFFNTHEVMTDVQTAIYRSRVVIADCTERNPNVFYELGIAHTIGKPVVLLTQSEDDVPFDIRHRRYIKYDFTPRGMAQLEKSLRATLNTILEDEEPKLPGGRYNQLANKPLHAELRVAQGLKSTSFTPAR